MNIKRLIKKYFLKFFFNDLFKINLLKELFK